uniref:CFAP107 n=1 Tax=Tetrahymena thermophila CU428 TaxID=452467 RepID=UPI002549C14C|nr:Chain 0G, CFAP107 [Tetrahymena thermophila CU428]8G2Z_1G Chain 1G, CFAP107 [Tetrahymena thermophila CU428]
MNAQTIQDNVNKYRFGVLIGNFAEEKFGMDMAQRQIDERLPNSTMKDSYGLKNSALNCEPSKLTPIDKEFNQHVIFNTQGVQQHILFGHGVKQTDYNKREYGTSYDLSFNQKIKPQTQIYSKYTPDALSASRTFHKDTIFEKDYQKHIPELGSKPTVPKDKARPYNEFTKTYDSTHMKIPLRK